MVLIAAHFPARFVNSNCQLGCNEKENIEHIIKCNMNEDDEEISKVNINVLNNEKDQNLNKYVKIINKVIEKRKKQIEDNKR